MNQQAEKYLSTLDRLPNTLKTYRWALDYYFSIAGEELSDENYEQFLVAVRNLSPSTKRVLRSAVMGLYAISELGDLNKRAKLNKHYSRKIQTKPVTFDRAGVEHRIGDVAGKSGPAVELALDLQHISMVESPVGAAGRDIGIRDVEALH